MPAIRDFTTQYTAVANAATISFPVPDYAQDDLLLAVITSDVNNASATWTLANWTVLYNVSNTTQPQQTVLWKIAGASETDPTFTRNVNESFDGALISIQDVDTTNPFGSPALYTNVSQAAAVKYSMPNLTTTVGDSLVLFVASNACNALGFPNIIEGPVVELFSQDGLSESTGIGWTFKHSTGATSGVTANSVASFAGINSTIQIAAPGGVATVIPTFIAADTSIYVNPINGTTAYNGDAALAATADTNFGVTLAGRNVSDATIAAATDYGINPYHSVGRMNNPNRTTNWSGAALDLAAGNNVDVTGKNVLVHTGPNTPGQIQRLAAAIKGLGVAFGMRSTAGNWKVWHVHGAGTSWGAALDVPLVINNDNTSGLIASTGTLDPAAVDIFGFWITGNGVSTTAWGFYQLWVLDTITLCGGSSTSPMDIGGIVTAVQGHEHRGVIKQGVNQLLVLMPLQIGDGGTNPVFMDLNDTAIEFPRQYDRSSKNVNYCSADNVAGITYYAGDSDTIKHRNSLISSLNKYKWGFHASSSTSATYNFSGLTVIGAGNVTLKSGIAVSEVTWSSCDNFDSSGSTLSNCTISTSTGTSALAITSAANMALITDCTFSGNNVAGDTAHSIELTGTGSHTFDNITFSGGGPAARSFNTTTGVNATNDFITTDATHGYIDGDPVYYQDQGGTQNMGLTDGTLYYVNAQSTTELSFHTTSADAIADANRQALTSAGGETHYIYSAKADVYNNSGGNIIINILNGGNTPTIRNSDGSSTSVVTTVNIDIHAEDENGVSLEGAQVFIRKSASYYDYTSHNTNNAVGDTTFEVNETVDTDLPQSGWLHVWKSSTNTKQDYRYASWSGKIFTLRTEVTGSTTSTGSSTSLISTSTNFLTTDIEEGDTIRNTTDGSWTIVDEIVDADNITTFALQGGSDNTWQSGDAFSLHKLATNYDNTDLVDIPIFNSQTDSNGDISTTFGGTIPAAITVRIRSNEGVTKYVPFNTSGSITSSGYSLTAILTEDSVAQ